MSRRRTATQTRRVPRDERVLSLEHWRKERAIRRALRGLARQRVVAILQPGNMLVVERGPSRREPGEAALRSCHLRGWAEPIANAVRSGSLGPDGTIPDGQVYDRVVPIYRITEAGWEVLHRGQTWVIMTFIVALASLVATILGIMVSGLAGWNSIFDATGIADTGRHSEAAQLSDTTKLSDATKQADAAKQTEGRVRSRDGVEIAYADGGSGSTTLLFIHGGLADRAFWAPQIAALSSTYRVVVLDLAGHGESGRDRKVWTIAAFAGDVRAVVEALDLRRTVLIGNSLGGPVALEAARLVGKRTIGVVGVDTLHDATARLDRGEFHARAEAFRKDFAGSCRAMLDSLFHPGAQPDLRAWVERRMARMSPEVVSGMMERFGDYDMAAAFRNAGVPIRAINGDLWPTRTEINRTVTPDFDAVVMTGAGHYPMLERPEEFNRHLLEIVAGLEAGVH